MSNFKTLKKLIGIPTAVLLLTMAAPNAMAAGTASGTGVTNFATVNYDVASVSQPAINSSSVAFVVDTRVDLTVSTDDVAAVSVTPGSNDNVMTFTVTNTGNAAHDFNLSAVALVGGAAIFGGTDNINADTVQVFVETAGGAGYQAISDTDTHINALAADASINVYIVSDFNTGYTDGDIASYHLLAEARIDDAAGTLGGALTETAGADTAASVDIVFADGAGSNDASGDAQYASQDDYQISAAVLTIGKTSSVVSDPINGSTNPKRIPGAVIQYEISISNGAGGATATSVAITDSLVSEISDGDIAFNTQYDAAAGNGFSISHPDYSGGAYADYTNVSGVESPARGGVEADWNVTTANVVTVTNIQLDAGESAVIRFRITIQ
ncbi:MAG: hypothetical protein COB71_02440 [Thiotrichales bacterium]|nr:MAG: hypothetical protein COB71_02440 [Thiotrichales bacterium]